MKKYSLFKFMVCALSLIAALGACSDDNESILLGSNDQLHFSCTEEEKLFTVCATGDWHITTDAQWLSFSKNSGMGNGQTREQITVTAAHNTGKVRQASFQLSSAGKTLIVSCEQEEGHPFKLGEASLSSSLQAGKAATNTLINIPYEYGYKGMKLGIHANLSGEASEGLAIEDENVTISDASGTIAIPLSGTPVKSGNLAITLVVDQTDISPIILNTIVNDRILLEQHFDLCTFGGDFVANLPGTMPVWGKDEDGKNVPPEPLGNLQTRTANQDGSNDLFSTMAYSYLISKGLDTWQGTKVYERPGYIKIGTASTIGKIMTPALTTLGNEKSDVKVSLRVAEWLDEQGGSLIIGLEGSGTPSITTYTYKHVKTKTGSEWENVQFTIYDAAIDTRIIFTTKENKRFAIDDLVIAEK